MFTGEYNHNIDNKGRLIIPSKVRDQLSGNFIITRGLDNCLFLYTTDEWQKLVDKISKLPVNRAEARHVSRFFLSAALECELDTQGRANISTALIEHAKLEKECVIIGVSNRLEIWNKDKWLDYINEKTESFDEIAENLEIEI